MKIAISNLKGGVGKSTLSQNLAVCFAHMGFKTCLVDTDTNQNSLAWSGVRPDALPSVTVVGATDPKALGKAVDNLHRDYDAVIIDGTPSLSEMTTRIIIAADLLLIPILPSAHDFRAMQPFFERLDQAREFRGEIPAFFIINQYSANANVYKRMAEAIRGLGIEVLETAVHRRAIYAETAIDGKGAYEGSDPKARDEMIRLTREVLDKAAIFNLIKAQ